MRRISLGLLCFALLVTIAGCGSKPMQVAVTPARAASALAMALSKSGAPYVYGGRGPDAFDCSGIVTWAYRQVVPGLRLYIGGGRTADDATIEALYEWNYQRVTLGELVPGDLVFISDGSATVTHGGLVVQATADTIRFLNASSYCGEVVEDEWPLTGERRGQRVVGYGRLLMTIE